MKIAAFRFSFCVMLFCCSSLIADIVAPPNVSEKPLLADNFSFSDTNGLALIVDLPKDINSSAVELEKKILTKLKESDIKVITSVSGDNLNIPELRICIDTLEISDSNQCVLSLQTSFARKVFFSANDRRRWIKADVWKTEPVLRVVSNDNKLAVICDTVLNQADVFITAYLVVDRKVEKPVNLHYEYISSKNSKVFHKADCSFAKKINPENLIKYKTRSDAIKDDKRPCKKCKP